MRKESVVQTIFSMVLVFQLAFSLIFSFPHTTNAHDSEQRNMLAVANPNDAVRPIIWHPDSIDKDFDGIQDSLEVMISQLITDRSAVLPVIVTLCNPVKSQDLDWFVVLGGRVTHVYRYVTYGFAGVIPASNISSFANIEKNNLSVIEYDAPVRYHLDTSVPLVRARPTVWDTYGYTGSPNYSIAIIDSGIDDSHSDIGPYGDLNFSRKIVGWYDATPDMSTAPEDYCEHGTHVAGIAAGTGDANSLQTSGFATTTWSADLNGVPRGYGYLHYGFEVLNPGLITLTCTWTSGNLIILQLRDETGNMVLKETSGRGKPLVLTYETAESGRYRPFVGIGGLPGESGSGYFSLRQTYPYQGRADGYNLFTGVAPTSKLVGVKVFDNTGSGTTSTVFGGMDWVMANRQTYNITIASMSLSLENGGTSTTFDQKADTMVENGIVTVVSAGNDYPDYTTGSPGTAAYVITVAATNDQNGITSYSSNGDPNKNEYGLVKPDVAAPGGSTGVGNLIISADSNDVDYEYSGQSDFTANDYQQMMGTSMSTPHVSGLAALVIEALSSWNWTKEEVLKVKMIICMTAFEVQSGESSNTPPLNRGEKDNKEGYGRISADAAVEAATMTYNVGELSSDAFGSNPSDKKVWARQVSLSAKNVYEFNLSVPLDADYDLYLYNGTSDSYGQPVILSKSVSASIGAEERILFTPEKSGTYYIVAKWISGDGSFSLQSTSTLLRDVAVVSVALSATEVYAGWLTNVTVAVRNNGGSAETFNVTVYYDVNVIGTQTVSNLAPDAMVNMTFSWNTTGVTPCVNYTIKAEASVVTNETYTFNNSLIDGSVKVKMWGDVTGDGVIDIYDLATVGQAYASVVGEPEYNHEADLNQDGLIDIRDLVVVAINYGKTC